MSSGEFEPITSASDQPQTLALDSSATEIDISAYLGFVNKTHILTARNEQRYYKTIILSDNYIYSFPIINSRRGWVVGCVGYVRARK
jgi:hypothetical protein